MPPKRKIIPPNSTTRDLPQLEQALDGATFFERYKQEIVVDKSRDEPLFRWAGRMSDIETSINCAPYEKRCLFTSPLVDSHGNPVLDGDGGPLRLRCEGWKVIRREYCVRHLGGTGKAMSRAQERLQSAADSLSELLLDFALGEGEFGDVDRATQLRAINSGLDRAGIRAGVDHKITIAPWQELLAEITGEEAEIDGSDTGAEEG